MLMRAGSIPKPGLISEWTQRVDNIKDCHSERSEESFAMAFKILRVAQDDIEINSLCPLPRTSNS